MSEAGELSFTWVFLMEPVSVLVKERMTFQEWRKVGINYVFRNLGRDTCQRDGFVIQWYTMATSFRNWGNSSQAPSDGDDAEWERLWKDNCQKIARYSFCTSEYFGGCTVQSTSQKYFETASYLCNTVFWDFIHWRSHKFLDGAIFMDITRNRHSYRTFVKISQMAFLGMLWPSSSLNWIFWVIARFNTCQSFSGFCVVILGRVLLYKSSFAFLIMKEHSFAHSWYAVRWSGLWSSRILWKRHFLLLNCLIDRLWYSDWWYLGSHQTLQ